MTRLRGEDIHGHQETTAVGFSSNNDAANRDEVTNLSLFLNIAKTKRRIVDHR